MINPMIETQNCSFKVANKEILKNISLAIRESDYFSIIGPKRTGKTTLLKCLIRILKIPAGVIAALLGGSFSLWLLISISLWLALK